MTKVTGRWMDAGDIGKGVEVGTDVGADYTGPIIATMTNSTQKIRASNISAPQEVG